MFIFFIIFFFHIHEVLTISKLLEIIIIRDEFLKSSVIFFMFKKNT